MGLQYNRFNDTARELSKCLQGCYEDENGKRYWYKGTVDLLFKMISFLGEGEWTLVSNKERDCDGGSTE